ncbi:MAG: hypothetical protein LC749_01365 [Actinobacteria bacterium]|nr:hypothetical protein [Actinomycetota bacterium]
MSLLTLEQLTELVETTQHDFIRIETLPSYDTAATTGDFRRWLDGETEPTWKIRRPWLAMLTQWAQEGRPRRRVRVIHDPPTSYERYACDWGYVNSVAAGELIRVVDLAEQSLPSALVSVPGDWSLIDGRDAVRMQYRSNGQFIGARHVDVQDVGRYRSAADIAWEAGEPFTAWWDRHPQHHRSAGRAA